MQTILRASVTEGDLEQVENCIFFTKLKALTEFIDEASILRKCITERCFNIFFVKNYLKNTILWYGHLCMRGSDDVVEEPLYPGTAKTAEGHLAGKLFQQAREGCQVSVNWQDSDSSSAKAITEVYPSVSIMHCAGHVGRAHSYRLTNLKAKKSFTKTYKDHHVVKHSSVTSLTSCCAKCNHRAGCGCVTDDFIHNARINHFLVCLQSGNDAQVMPVK